MADLETRVVIRAEDQASEELSRIQGSVQGLQDEMGKVDGTTVQNEMNKVAEGAKGAGVQMEQGSQFTRGFTGSLGGIPLGAAAAGAALGAFAVSAVKAASDLQAIENRAEVVFGESFPKLEQEINSVANNLRRSSSDLLNFATSFGMLAKDVGFTGEIVEDFSVSLTRLSVAIGKAFPQVSDTEAFEALRRAVAGSGKSLQQFGIVMNDATLQAFAYSKGIQGNVTELSGAQASYLRYIFLLEKSADIQKIAEKNAGSFSDRVKELSGAWGDFKETLGGPALYVASAALDTINGAAHAAGATIHFLAGSMFRLAQGATTLFSKVQSLLGFGSEATKQTADMLGGIATEQFTQVNDALDAMNPAEQSEKRKSAIEAEAKALEDAIPSLDEFKNTMAELGKIGGGGGGAGKQIREDAEEARDALGELVEEYGEARADIEDEIRELEASHEKKMTSIRDEIEKVEAAIGDLADEYEKSLGRINRSEAESVVEEEENIAKLREKLAEERGRLQKSQAEGKDTGDQEARVSSIQKQLDTELAAYERYISTRSGLDAELAEARRRAGLTDFERTVEDIGVQRTEETAAFEERKIELEAERAALEESLAFEQEVFTVKRQEMELTRLQVQGLEEAYMTSFQNMETVTKETIEKLRKELLALRQIMSQTAAELQATSNLASGVSARRAARSSGVPATFIRAFAHGGIVEQPTLAMIGESGREAVIPMDGGNIPVKIIEKNGSPISVVIESIEVHNEADMDRFVRELTRKIQLQYLRSS